MLDDVEIIELNNVDIQVTFDQSWPTASFSGRAFGPHLTVTTMRPDGHCGFRAIAHAIFKCQDDWNDIRTSLLMHLESYGKDDANLFGAIGGPRPSADGPGHSRIIHLMQNCLLCIINTAS